MTTRREILIGLGSVGVGAIIPSAAYLDLTNENEKLKERINRSIVRRNNLESEIYKLENGSENKNEQMQESTPIKTQTPQNQLDEDYIITYEFIEEGKNPEVIPDEFIHRDHNENIHSYRGLFELEDKKFVIYQLNIEKGAVNSRNLINGIQLETDKRIYKSNRAVTQDLKKGIRASSYKKGASVYTVFIIQSDINDYYIALSDSWFSSATYEKENYILRGVNND